MTYLRFKRSWKTSMLLWFTIQCSFTLHVINNCGIASGTTYFAHNCVSSLSRVIAYTSEVCLTVGIPLFTALHGMQRGLTMRFLSVCPSLCPSVCPSVCQTRALWQNGRKLCLDFYIIWKTIYPSFLRRRMVGGGDPFYLKFWVNRPALARNRRFWTNNRSQRLSRTT